MTVEHYPTTAETRARSLLALRCRSCEQVFLYSREEDRKVDEAHDRAYVVCPCGNEFTLAVGGVSVISPWGGKHKCSACGKMTRDTTAGCDHCDFEDK